MTKPPDPRIVALHGEKKSDAFDLFDPLTQAHWGQLRLCETGISTVLQVKPDRTGEWQDFFAFIIENGHLMYGNLKGGASASKPRRTT